LNKRIYRFLKPLLETKVIYWWCDEVEVIVVVVDDDALKLNEAFG
jgi:hypothetical protein